MHHNSKQLQKLQADLVLLMLRYASYNKRTLSYGSNLLQSCQLHTPHLLHLDTTHRQLFPPSLIALPPHLSASYRLATPPLLFLRLLSQNAIIPNLAWLLLPGNSLHLLNQQALNSSMYLFDTTSLYSNCAPTSADYTLTPVEFWIFIIQIEIWSASLFTLVMKLSSVHT
jgi:hypothetical protein